MGLRKDIWRPAIVMASFEAIAARGTIEGLPVQWLPPMGPFRFLADPFGLWRDDKLHLFCEGYDYRHRVGWIETLTYDASFELIDRAPALVEPWHLSYPLTFEAEGETWMLPEAHKSGGLSLYRAADFPRRWERAQRIELDHVPVDPTPIFHDGLWWLFYTSASREPSKMQALHCAWAERLTGTWHPHPLNPIRVDAGSARPGGTARVIDRTVVLPVQDCRQTYGGAIRLLRFDTLTPDRVAMSLGPTIEAPAAFAPFVEGLHTLSSAGPVTLVDVKRTELSPRGLGIEIRREAGKLLRRLR